jgi:putative NIF3 family GTP cyclohydrolase 1 type 2
MIGLVDATPLDSGEAGSGMGLFGAFGKAQEGDELPGMILRKWELSWVKYYNVPQTVSRLAVVGGSGGDLWPLALERGADVLVTADMKYHQIMEAVENGLGIIVADHGEMERVTINELARLLSGLLQTVVVTVDTGGFSAGRVSIS